MTFPAIGELVPHEGAMLLLDSVLEADAATLMAEVTIRPGTLFCDGAGVGAWVGIEYMAQAIAAHGGYQARLRGEAVKIGMLAGARRYQCSVPLFALGARLHVLVRLEMQGENGLAAYECRIDDADSGSVLAHATVTVFIPKQINEFLQRSAS